MNGIKNDSEKPQMALLPFDSLEEVARVLTFGARKYSPDNWRKVPEGLERYESAMLRHLAAYHRGEAVDQESGLSHLAHAACCILFMIYFEKQAKSYDTTLDGGPRV
jgi:hypothetical protein